jgi:hypothetical protein
MCLLNIYRKEVAMFKWMAALLGLAMSGGIAQAQDAILVAPLDVATVTTGGAAVTAIAHYHRLKGGWLQNPPTATANLCITEIDAAAATTTPGGNVTCIVPGQTYILAPSGNSVSVVSSDSAHPFSGYGWQ